MYVLGALFFLKDNLILVEMEFLEAREHSLDIWLSIGAKCGHAFEEQLLNLFIVSAKWFNYFLELGVGYM